MSTGGRPTEEVERRVMAESGWLGLEVAEALDGSGATFAEVAVVLQEMGRAAAASDYLGSVVLGVGALNALEPGAEAESLLRAIASGESRVAVALPSVERGGANLIAPFRIEKSATGLRLSGRAEFVPDVVDADRILLTAADDGGTMLLAVVAPGTPGLAVLPQPLIDVTRRFGTVEAEGAEVATTDIGRFTGEPEQAARRLVDRGAVAIACDSLGVSEAMLDATVAYAGTRQQFGRPIGSFQAVKHACADMLVQIAVGRELLAEAVAAVADNRPEAWAQVSMAKSQVCQAAVEVAGKAVQLHGGIGYTWEKGIHVFLKRALLNRSLFGSPATHRRRLATRYR